ncbi:MAG: ATP-grasp domain-containing protein [Sulfurospirillum sp.]|nr:ATP-grasp domain-containing protein [Sulfurospirillum sp.]
MDIMIVGSGGREYSIGLALSKDKGVDKLYFAPGNGATCKFGENILISDFESLANFAKQKNIELTIIGSETYLVDGIVDVFKSHNLNIFGSSKAASRLEGSKIFMKNFLARNSIPTANYIETTQIKKADTFIDSLQTPVVIKADGLCAGKGVIIATSHKEAKQIAANMLSGESFGDAGNNSK